MMGASPFAHDFPVVKHIQEEDHTWAAKNRRREKKRLKKEGDASMKKDEDASTHSGDNFERSETESHSNKTFSPPRFY